VVSHNHVIYPSVLKQVPFDLINDITPIAVIGATPLVLAVNPKLPAKDMKELVALLKASPGKYNYGSSGNGMILQDFAAGQIDFGVGALPAMQDQIEAGTIRAICVSTSARIPAAPDIPAAMEQGYPKYLVEAGVAVIGPEGMVSDLVKEIQAAFSEAFSTPEVKASMARQGNTINVGNSDAAAPFFRSEMAHYAATVKRAGVVPE
jgi:tripartite-type tricarboxylate transporter receptor subunit TctC